MRSSRSEVGALSMDTDLRQVAARNLAGLVGLGTLALVAAVAVALATWSATDPSYSHATKAPVKNLVGYPGAVVADLAMQFVGLAATVALLPALAIGWRLVLSGEAGLTRGRLTAWIAGTLLTSAALAGLPVADGWPLPIGLGGAIGDLMVRLPISLSGSAEFGRFAGLALFGLAAIFANAYAIGWRRAPGRARVSALRQSRDDDGDDEEDDDRPGFMPLAVIHHWTLVARANLLRLFTRRRAQPGSGRGPSARRREENDDEDYGARDHRPVVFRGPQPRLEPAFEVEPVSRLRPTVLRAPEERFGEEEFEDEADFAPPPPPARPTAHEVRPESRSEASAHAERRPPPPVAEDDYDYDAEQEAEWQAPPRREEAPARPTPKPMPTPLRGPAAQIGMDPAERRVPIDQMHGPMAQVKKPAREAAGNRLLSGEGYQFPPIVLLSEPRRLGPSVELSEEILEGNAGILEGVLDDFGVKGEIIHVRPGPVVTLYELEPAPGVKSSRVIGLSDDIARSMSAISARVAVVPGRNVIGIELPNQRRETVYLREMIASEDFETTKAKLAMCLGKTIGGEPVIADLARMPHLLVAGTTGSGKSVAINTMILSLLYRLTPEQCKLIMIDPKMLELSVYDGIPHLLAPVVTDPKKAVVALKWTVREMEDRYRKMSKLGVRNIDGFNARVAEAKARGEVLTREVQTGFHRQTGEPIYEQEQLALDPLPYIVVIVDEMADLMMVAGKEIEGAIQRIAQMARAAGIHIIMATQRPSVDVITGTIKANFPTRISFQVTSKIDSRTILGEQGAEQLLGQGDMLYMAGGGRIQRVHGPFVADDEVEKIVAHLKRQGAPQYLDAITAGDEDSGGEVDPDGETGGLEDSNDLYDRAVAVVLKDKKASTSYVQRRLQIGYNRAASLIERMEKEGIVGPPNHAGKREILIDHGDR